jgi:DMSO reductase anchor subunit
MGGSFNTRAFIHDYGPYVVRMVRHGFIVFAFILPFSLLLPADEGSLVVCVLVFLLQYLGLLVERWYFFIEAEHPQNIYYQMVS